MKCDFDKPYEKVELNQMMGITTAFIALFFSFAPFNHASAQIFLNPWEPHVASHELWQFEPGLSFYSSSSNYDDNTKAVTSPSFTSYRRNQLQLGVDYGVSERVTAYSLLRVVQVSASNGSVSKSHIGPSDQTFGLNFRFWQLEEEDFNPDISPFAAFQIQGDFPTYDSASAQHSGALFLGDGSVDGVVGILTRIRLLNSETSQWSAQGGVGYQFRNDGFSAALPWTVALQFREKPLSFFINVGVDALQSFASDKTLPNSTDNLSRIQVGSMGSYFTNAVNPSQINAKAEIGNWFSNDLAMSLRFLTSVEGQTAPRGYEIAANATFRLGRIPDAPENAPRHAISSVPGFAKYDLEGKVLSVSDRFHIVKINRGKNDGVALGQTFDMIEDTPSGRSGTLIARGKITNVKEDEAVITIEEYFREVWIQPGFLAKRVLE